MGSTKVVTTCIISSRKNTRLHAIVEFLEHNEHQNEKTFQESKNTENPQLLKKKVEDESKNEKIRISSKF